MNLWTLKVLLIGMFGLLATQTHATTLPASTHKCLTAGRAAAYATGTPPEIMTAITLVETGRRQDGKTLPWPWTINVEGKGHWFATKAKAIEFVKQAQRKGAKSIDVGCYQINLRWHPDAFQSLDQAFDPLANATYAAKYLNTLKSPDEKWIQVAGDYHSGHEKYAARYRAKVLTVLGTKLISDPVTPAPPLLNRRTSGGVKLAWHAGSSSKSLLRQAPSSLLGVWQKRSRP